MRDLRTFRAAQRGARPRNRTRGRAPRGSLPKHTGGNPRIAVRISYHAAASRARRESAGEAAPEAVERLREAFLVEPEWRRAEEGLLHPVVHDRAEQDGRQRL